MKKVISTNCKFDLIPISSCKEISFEIHQLDYYSSQQHVNEIFLMLPDIIDMAGIDLIKNITNIINSYPLNIPCYLFGVNYSIMADGFPGKRDIGCDKIIKTFMDSVFARSNAVCVRGELFKKWLVQALHFEDERIFVISENRKDAKNIIHKFISEYYCDCPFEIKSIVDFNCHPQSAFISASKNIATTIEIDRPYLVLAGDQRCRLHADIKIGRNSRNIYVEYDPEYRDYIEIENSDAFLTAILPFAMRTGQDISCQAPVSEELLHNINEILVPALCLTDSRLHAPKITAPTVRTAHTSGMVGLCFSCGVDSFYSLAKYLNSPYQSYAVTHLFVGNYLYTKDAEIIYKRTEKVADLLNLKIIKANTNIHEEFYEIPHLFWHAYKVIFQAMPLKKLLGKIIYSSGFDYSLFNPRWNATQDTADYQLLILSSLSTKKFNIIECGGEVTRLDKVEKLINFPAAYNNLNVCLHPGGHINCGKCEKCIRTLLELDLLNALDIFSGCFDIKSYKKNKTEYLRYMIDHRDRNFFEELYQGFLNKKDRQLMELLDK